MRIFTLRSTAVTFALVSVLSLLAAVPVPAVAEAFVDTGWVQVGSPTPPFRRIHPTMAFDGEHTLVFGGSVTSSHLNGNGLMDDTWTFDGGDWTRHEPASSPTPRAGARAVWDAARGEVVLFGGYLASGLAADTWTWDGATWTKEMPAHSPPARWVGGLVFDSATDTVVLFGGLDEDGVALGDTWTWDGTDWTSRVPLLSPPPRALFGTADGSATSSPVLFGGMAAPASNIAYGDTWTWDGANTTWLPQPAALAPTPRFGVQMAYDATLGKTVLYGGSNPTYPRAWTFGASSYTHFDDTWTWDGTAWTSLGAGGSPRDLFYGAMAYNPTTRNTYVFGGTGDPGESDEIWSFDGATWTDPYQVAPTELDYASLARESNGSPTAILFGGQNKMYEMRADTWRWDGDQWHALAPAHAPSARVSAAMAFHAPTGLAVLFGGHVDTVDDSGVRQVYEAADTWTWDGSDWTQQSPATSPSARSMATMVYDAARGEVVLFGGQDTGVTMNDTWTWDGHSWKRHQPPVSPPTRFGASMTYDPVARRVVLFGGSLPYSAGRLDDTWTWDGTTWTEQMPNTRPPARAFAAMAYDPRSQSAILFGGCDPCLGPVPEGTWRWDGVDWTEIPTETAPSLRTSMVVVDGDSWTENGQVRTRPLLAFGGRRPVLGYYDEGTDATADLWAFNAPELAGRSYHVYGPSR